MFNKALSVGFLLLTVTCNSYANDSDRIDSLEKEVQGLKLRLSKIEALPDSSSNSQELATTNEGWKSIKNWRKLSVDMNANDVLKVLGEPLRVRGGDMAFWSYPDNGNVDFFNGKVRSWNEPIK